jgi:hypothetical protein
MDSAKPFEETLKEAWPWAKAFSRYLHQTRPTPFLGSHLMFGSDYSGDHAKSPFRIYGFLVADEEGSPQWPARCHAVREKHLKDGRRMSFKNMNDVQRRRALIPFLEAAEYIEGHVVVVAVTKQLRQMSSAPTSMQVWRDTHGLQAKWDLRAFEQMVRVAHFFSMFLGTWSSPGMDVTWITDDGSIVANAGRLDDVHQFAARLSALFVPHQLGVFAMNTVSLDSKARGFEDFVAIPDLAAGMIGEVLSVTRSQEQGRRPNEYGAEESSIKSEVIVDWFWHRSGPLKKICILISPAATKGQFGVGELRMELR